MRLFTSNRDIDRYLFVRDNVITEILHKDNEDYFYLLAQYIGLASFLFNVTVLDTNYDFGEFLHNLKPPMKDSNITLITPNKLESGEESVRRAVLNSMEVLVITNIGLLPFKGEIEKGPKKYSRSEVSESIFGIYRWLHNIPIPWKIIGNISWSRKVSNITDVEAPGGKFRKMVTDTYKIETIEDHERYKLVAIHKGKPKDGIKVRLDKKTGFYLPTISAQKKNMKEKDLLRKDIKAVLNHYISYIKTQSFVDSIFNQFKFIAANGKQN